MTNPIYTADAIASVLCDSNYVQSEIAARCNRFQRAGAEKLAQNAAGLITEYASSYPGNSDLDDLSWCYKNGPDDFAEYRDKWVKNAEIVVARRLPRSITRAPNFFALFGWETIVLAIISAIVQALLDWYFAANDSDELRAALRGMG